MYVCVCLFPFIVKASPDGKKKKCNARVRINDSMQRKYFCIKYFVSASKTIIGRTFRLETMQKKCQSNREKSREVKSNSYKLSKTNGKSAKHNSYLPNLGSCSDSAQGQYCLKLTLHREGLRFTKEGLPKLV